MVPRFVPKRAHGVLDFLTVGLFIAGPEVFRVHDSKASSMPARAFGVAVAVSSLLTDYGPKHDALEFGGPRVFSMKSHLIVDAIGGVTVGLAPWVTGSWRKGWNYWAPQLLLMSSETFFALTTKIDDDEEPAAAD
jgi:hypothetical protein